MYLRLPDRTPREETDYRLATTRVDFDVRDMKISDIVYALIKQYAPDMAIVIRDFHLMQDMRIEHAEMHATLGRILRELNDLVGNVVEVQSSGRVIVRPRTKNERESKAHVDRVADELNAWVWARELERRTFSVPKQGA